METCEGNRTLVVATINTPPLAPSTTGAAACGASSVALSASGGLAGQYRWYTVASGGTAILGETSDTYTTPVIVSTTTYYVSIDNGTCESARAAVIGTINSIPAPPITNGANSCTDASLTLSASGGNSGEYRWYDVPSGGSAIVAETNANFTTPVLTNTTTYYVAINTGVCESTREPVTATIGGPACSNAPPTITPSSTSITIAGVASFDLVALIADADGNLDLSTLRVVTQPSSEAIAQISNGILTVDYSGLSFAGTDRLTIEVCDVLGSCTQQELTIEVEGDVNVYNGISPNGDTYNELWIIQNITSLPETRENRVTLFNRWGDIVFEVDNYDNDQNVFAGIGKNGDQLPSGVYFYQIDFKGQREAISGYLNVKYVRHFEVFPYLSVSRSWVLHKQIRCKSESGLHPLQVYPTHL